MGGVGGLENGTDGTVPTTSSFSRSAIATALFKSEPYTTDYRSDESKYHTMTTRTTEEGNSFTSRFEAIREASQGESSNRRDSVRSSGSGSSSGRERENVSGRWSVSSSHDGKPILEASYNPIDEYKMNSYGNNTNNNSNIINNNNNYNFNSYNSNYNNTNDTPKDNLDYLVGQLHIVSGSQLVQLLKSIASHLTTNNKEPDPKTIDILITSLASRLATTTTSESLLAVMNTSTAVFSSDHVANIATTTSLTLFLKSLICLFLQMQNASTMSTYSDRTQPVIGQAVKELLDITLQGCDPNVSLVILYQELRNSLSLPLPAIYSPQTDVIMYCLTTTFKRVSATPTHTLSKLPELMGELHLFLSQYTPALWKGRECMPFNMVKHILLVVVQTKKQELVETLASSSSFRSLIHSAYRSTNATPTLIVFLNHLLAKHSESPVDLLVALLGSENTTKKVSRTSTTTPHKGNNNNTFTPLRKVITTTEHNQETGEQKGPLLELATATEEEVIAATSATTVVLPTATLSKLRETLAIIQRR